MTDSSQLIPAPAFLKDLKFEDLYISENGEFNFVGHSGHMQPSPDNYDGPRPTTEILILLRQIVARRKSEGRDEFSILHDDVRYRVAVIRSVSHLWYVLRRAAREVPSLSSFNGIDRFKDNLLNLGRREGLIMTTGPTGSGKTTLLASLLKSYLQNHGGVAVTIEDPPELLLEGKYENGWCYQQHIPEHEFPKGLKAALRFRPRYIYVGELRTREAAMTAIQASITGHVVLTTMHAGSISQAILNLANIASGGQNNELVWRSIAEGLNGVIQLKRLKNSPNPEARPFLLSSAATEDGIRQNIRLGRIESLQNDIETFYNRAR